MVKEEAKAEIIEKPKPAQAPLVFISHDARDAELAGAFSKLLGSVTAGMLKSFRSSDKKGGEGIEFGDEWYKRLMTKIQTASDVVCLLTERSLERPWILYEAGVAKGKLNKPVLGIALGIPLSKVGTGPFYQFQNCDDTEDSLRKLIMQLASRVPGLAPDPEVVTTQVQTFIAKVKEILKKLGKTNEKEETSSESSTALLLEELKTIVRRLPRQLERHFPSSEFFDRRPRRQNIHPMFVRKFFDPGEPVTILILTSLFRDEIPWLEVLGWDFYEALQGKNTKRKENARAQLLRAIDTLAHSSLGVDVFGESEKDIMMFRESMDYLNHITRAMSLE